MTNEVNPLGYEKLPILLRGYAIPSVIAMLVSSLYNIVDQIFIGQGVGSASRFSLELGTNRKENAAQAVGTTFTMVVTLGILYVIIIEAFLDPLLYLFGGRDCILPYAESY